MDVQLRDYQVEAIQAIKAEWQTHNRTLVVQATGTGKTIVFLALLNDVTQSGTRGRALILSHRQELVTQPVERAQQFWPQMSWRMGIVMADQDECDKPILVATVQTLNSGRRIERIRQYGEIDYVIIDEAHHGVASTYRAVLDAFPRAKILGVTATPIRTDGDGLRRVFESVAYQFPIQAAIERGALVPFDALGFSVPVHLDGLKESEDGWEPETLGDLLKAENVLEVVHQKWAELAPDRLTIGFTASVAQAHATAAYFRGHGVAAEALDGTTPRDTRAAILARFKRGETRVVLNCQVLTEGFDAPETGAVLMIAPTKSDLVYVQRLGRGLRTAPGKTNCLVLDFAPLDNRNVIMAGDVLGKPRDVKKAEEQAERAGVLLGGLRVDQMGLVASVDPNEIIIKVLDYLRRDELAWTLDGGLAVAGLSTEAMLAIVLPDVARISKGEQLKRQGSGWTERHERLLDYLKAYKVLLMRRPLTRAGTLGHWQVAESRNAPDLDSARHVAEAWGREYLDPTLARRDRRWRTEPATPGQIGYLMRLGLDYPDRVTRGQAGQLISLGIAQQQSMRYLEGRERQVVGC